MRRILTLLITVVFFATTYAQTSFEEIFNLNIGVLNNQNGWTGNTSFQVVSDGMNLSGYFFDNIEQKVAEIRSSGGKITRDNALTNPLTTGTAYLSFLAKINDKNNLRAVADYQVSIGKSVFATSFAGVGFYRDDVNGGVIKAALQTNNSADWVNTTTQTFVEKTVYHVVLKYEFIATGNDQVSVFISDSFMATEPATPTLTTTATGTLLLDNIGSVVLNSHLTATSAEVLRVDGFQLGNSWNGFTTVLQGMPVELTGFSGKEKNEHIQLDWTTATEHDNDYFTIRKSRDGVVFTPIGKVRGQGDSRSEVAYQFVDQHPYSGVNYYQLQQTDFDGTSTTSEMIVINRSARNAPNIFPNPATDQVTIELAPDGADPVGHLTVTGSNGQVILNQSFARLDQVNLFTGDWTSGWYLVQLYFENGQAITQKLFVR